VPDDNPADRTFCYNELWTTEVEQSKQFYGDLFGWAAVASPIGDGGSYHIFKRGERDVAGLLALPQGEGATEVQPHWLSYVLVDDVDALATRAPSLGGTVCVPPADIPGIGRFSVFTDPSGVRIGVFQNPTED
jgi:predicted enzyme related to lactoylglutathione lyase